MHLQSLAALEAIRAQVSAGWQVGFVFGNFNVIHPGHLRLLKFARECSDFLVVGVNGRNQDGAILDESLRLEAVRMVSLVNYAFMLHDTAADFIRQLRPAFVVKGKEHESTSQADQEAVEAGGGKLLFCSGDVTFASIDLLKKQFAGERYSGIFKPDDFPARHGFSVSDLKPVIEQFKGRRVVVIGDLIVDDYIECDPLGMSQEDATLVVAPVLNQQFVGGAGIVAGHSAALGCSTTFLTVANDDFVGHFAHQTLANYGVACSFLPDSSRPTTLKQRYRARGKTLLRVSHLKQHWIEKDLQDQLLHMAEPLIRDADLVVLSDFNYGCLPQPVVDALCDFCNKAGVPFVADSQSSSQVGDICRFKNALLIKPTEREARLALRDFQSGLIAIIDKLQWQTSTKNIAVTLGAEGVIARTAKRDPFGWTEDRLPAFNPGPKDTAGAGDCFLVATALALIGGADIWKSIYIGSLAAACQVGRVGNVPLSSSAILTELAA
jgi:rfaE bifunctional protein kinase chain/domain